MVLCVAEKSQVQALARSQPAFPRMPGMPEKRTHDYARHGTTSLFAASDTADGEQVLERMLPLLKHQSGAEVEGGVANRPNAYDDIVAALDSGEYREIILETPHRPDRNWLHVDLPQQIAHLGDPLATLTATPSWREPVPHG